MHYIIMKIQHCNININYEYIFVMVFPISIYLIIVIFLSQFMAKQFGIYCHRYNRYDYMQTKEAATISVKTTCNILRWGSGYKYLKCCADKFLN